MRKEAAIAKAKALSGDVSDSDEDSDSGPKAPTVAENLSLAAGNPNSVQNAHTGGPSRRELEAKRAAEAKERYQKLHAAGKTDEAKADMARLALIRKEREQKAQLRKEEMAEKKAAADAKLKESGRRK